MNLAIRTFEKGTALTRRIEVPSGACKLAATLYHPAGTPRAVVILNGATGVRQSYYADFATWLATEQNLACLTFDYRDYGASRRGALRASKARMVDWCLHDQVAMRDHVWSLLPGVPIWHLGHSIGGMGLPFQDGVSQIERVITVASGPVHLSDHPWPYRAVAASFWYGPVPLSVRALGYLPGRSLKIGPNLPAGVYWQWRKWCTSDGFFASDFGGDLPYPDWCAVRCPVKIIAVSDDDLVPPKAVWRGMDFHREARKVQLTLKPAQYGLARVGHVGMFAPKAKACWADIIA